MKYAIKMHEGHQVDNILSLYDKQPLPPPPKPGEIDCVLAGFPWCLILTFFLIIKADIQFRQPTSFTLKHVPEGKRH